MRIALVSAFDPNPPPSAADSSEAHVGGVERVFREVSRALARRGHQVTLVCSTAGATADGMECGVQVLRRHRRRTILRAPVADLAAAVPNDSDVVHVAATYPFTTPAVLRRAYETNCPSVLDFHFEPDPGTALGRLAAGVYLRAVPPVYRLARSVIVRSMAYGRSAPSLDSIPEARWRVVPNGVDPERFRPAAQRAAAYLLFVGRLVPYKGLEVLLRALARAPPGLPLYVVGDGPQRHHLEALARELGVNALFLGRVPDGDLPGLYAQAALTLLPSITGQECFGISILESMACGTPVVASDLPGVSELARLGGFVAKRGDARDLALQIQRALRHEGLRRGTALADPIHGEFSWDAVTRRLESVYEEVAGPTGAAVATR